ncbi:MAG: 1-acyl-sn-glycerol-3-phosphate acyltransferase [Brumimicrobium sp.]|nr:1-acyl-sn-glycerol-3-phosphate acyltransferase [Brumimicrobium sp.]MCO5267655.1 1-acyl-sn-glycerol-3-phosphate acyltransferase [Brumimicrobium sp.]
MIYRLLQIIINIGIHLYYREIRINNAKNLELITKKPTIIIANHPNTIMDAFVIGTICKSPVYFMTKATVFTSPLKLRLLKSIKMIPINRNFEKSTKGVDNRNSLSACFQLLKEGKTLGIFPEGTSFQERVLRPLQTGTAKIALETEQQNDWKLGLQVITIGTYYAQPEKFRSDILINIDEPIHIGDFQAKFEEDKKATVNELTEIFRKRLENVLVTTETKEDERLIEEIFQILNTRYISSEIKGIQKEMNEMKDIKESFYLIKESFPERINEIRRSVHTLNVRLGKLKIAPDFLDRKFRTLLFLRQILFSSLFLLFMTPIALFGLIHNFFQYWLTDKIVLRISKDIEYYSSLAIVISAILYPIVYTSFILIISIWLPLHWWGTLIYIILMPTTGLFAFWYFKYLQHIRYKIHFLLLKIGKNRALQELLDEKAKIRSLLNLD